MNNVRCTNRHIVKRPFKKRKERKLPDGKIDTRWKSLKRIYFNTYILDTIIDGLMTEFRTICYKPEAYKKSTEPWVPEDGVPYNDYGVIPKYRKGDILAISMNYQLISEYWKDKSNKYYLNAVLNKGKNGWKDKRAVKREDYIYRIEIIDTKVERFNDISDEDILSSGVFKLGNRYAIQNVKTRFDTPRDAYICLWRNMSRVKPWESNPFVCVYKFKLLKAGEDFEPNILETIKIK